MTPLCPRCLMQTEHSWACDAYYCASPVCGGSVTGVQIWATPPWRGRLNWFTTRGSL